MEQRPTTHVVGVLGPVSYARRAVILLAMGLGLVGLDRATTAPPFPVVAGGAPLYGVHGFSVSAIARRMARTSSISVEGTASS